MSINFSVKKCLNFVFVLLFLAVTALPCLAEENIISSVTISKSKSNPNGYELSIDSSKTVDFKTELDTDGSIWFDLKNSVLAENAGTIYDDVTGIDNVVVKQLDRKVRIYVKGNNAQNTELIFLNSLFDTKKQAKKVVINRPVDEYKSTSGYDNDDLESQDDIQAWNDNSFNFYHLVSETLSGAKESAIGIFLILASALIFIFAIIKTITSKISQDTEPLIGLNNANNIRATMPEQITSKAQIKEMRTEDALKRDEVIQNAQAQLAKAHNKYQEYLQNKYKKSPLASKPINVDVLKKTIAASQYKKNEKNPYLDQEVIKMDRVNSHNLNQSFIPPRPKKNMNNAVNSSPYIQKPSPRLNHYSAASTGKDNSSSLKFLESVSKIYEQSGREDLAQGLKKSISKSQMKV